MQFEREKDLNFGQGVECYGLNVYVPKNSYVEALTPSLAVFRNWASTEGTKVK